MTPQGEKVHVLRFALSTLLGTPLATGLAFGQAAFGTPQEDAFCPKAERRAKWQDIADHRPAYRVPQPIRKPIFANAPAAPTT